MCTQYITTIFSIQNIYRLCTMWYYRYNNNIMYAMRTMEYIESLMRIAINEYHYFNSKCFVWM